VLILILMNKYEFISEDDAKITLSFSTNFDVFLSKYKEGVIAEHVFFFNCRVGSALPAILRYCFENDIDLKERIFLKELPSQDMSNFNEFEIKYALNLPSKYPCFGVRSIDENLSISSVSGYNTKVSLKRGDIAELVEGFLRILKDSPVNGAYIECAQIIQYYHACLQEGTLK